MNGISPNLMAFKIPMGLVTWPMAKRLPNGFWGLHAYLGRENKPFKVFFSGSRTAE